MTKPTLKAIALMTFLTSIGCSLNLPIAPAEEERDTTGKYDGKWALEINSSIGNCRGNLIRAYMDVQDGIGRIGPIGKGYISSTGNFRIKATYNTSRTIRLYGGNLEKSKGRVIIDSPYSPGVTNCSSGLSLNKVE